jgi:serine phosphatase RsbU (regulator of sigma subunit)
MRHLFYILFVLSTLKIGYSQHTHIGSYFLTNYSPTDYKAGNQNWAIIQDDNGIMYFGNNEGILEFDGQNWRKIDPAYIVSAEKDSNGIIYMGGRENLGYLQTKPNGSVAFKSIKHLITDTSYSIRYIRNIVFHEDKVWFNDENGHILVYDGNKITVKRLENWIGLFKKQNDTLYVQTKQSLGYYENGKYIKLPKGEIFANLSLRNIHRINNKTIIVTRTQGLFIRTQNGFEPWRTSIDNLIKESQVYVSGSVRNQIILGTVESGVIAINEYGQKIFHMNEKSGMINHDHCSIFVDREGNIWSGLEFGISQIYFNSPFSYFNEASGLNNSAIYSIGLHNDKLFVGTARGLYYSNWKSINDNISFNLIQGNSGRKLWDIEIIDDNVITSSSNIGMHSIQYLKARHILKSPNINKLISTELSNIYIGIGEHGGAYTITIQNENIAKSIYHENIPIIKKAFISKDQELWGLKHNNEIISYKFNKDYTKLIDQSRLANDSLLPPKSKNSLFKLKDQLLVASDSSTYIIDIDKKLLFPHDHINNFHNLHIYNTQQDIYENWWFVGKKSEQPIIGQISEEETITNTHPLSFDNLAIKEELAFYPIDSSQILIGASDRLVVYHAANGNIKQSSSKLLIRNVILNNTLDSLNTQSETTQSSNIEKIPYNNNALIFKYIFINYENSRSVQYKYKLEGFDKHWSNFTNKTEKEFSFIPKGEYTFRVKAYISEKEVDEATFTFSILPPWYGTIWAYLIYLLTIIGITFLIRYLSIKKIENENIKLENEVSKRTREIQRKNNQLEMQKEEISAQRDEIGLQQQKIVDSIEYARHIQGALLAEKDLFKEHFSDSFILFKPKDIVSGDFYWFKQIKNHLLFTVADCTGHGVPGAFMSIMGISFLNEIVRRNEITSPNMVLNELNKQVKQSLSNAELINSNENEIQKYLKSEIKDGIELAFADIDTNTQTLYFAGAESPLYLFRNNELIELEGTPIPIGIHYKNMPFELHTIQLEPNDCIYLFSDGFKDQFGGDTKIKFSTDKFKKMLKEHHSKSFEDQKNIYCEILNDWKKDSDQIDDITLIGIKV